MLYETEGVVLVYNFFCHFSISFWLIKKLNDSKNKKLKVIFYELIVFEFIQLLNLLKSNTYK
jgi:hypothetical protein